MPTVLVVDDSSVDRRLAAGLLEHRLDILFAEDGKSALAALESEQTDVVVTDLQMPRMDGLELVNNVRLNYPDVPVIVMTAHGSEAAAVRALESGAASYVPKSQLNDKLLRTVEEILELASTDHSYAQLIACATETIFRYELENDERLINPLVDLTQQMVHSMGICDATERLRLGMALEQALLNAIYHGNLEIARDDLSAAREAFLSDEPGLISERLVAEPFDARRVAVELTVNRDEARFTIRDEGPGFEVQEFLQSEVDVTGEGGRGLVLMRSFMDDVQFNDAGNEVVLVKRRDPNANGG